MEKKMSNRIDNTELKVIFDEDNILVLQIIQETWNDFFQH